MSLSTRLIGSRRPMKPTGYERGSVGGTGEGGKRSASIAFGITTIFFDGIRDHAEAASATESDGTTTTSAYFQTCRCNLQCHRGRGCVVWIDWRNCTPGSFRDARAAAKFAWTRKLKTVSTPR